MSSSAAIETEQPDLILKYDQPATNWEKEGLALGNGFLGATVYGTIETERILLNEHSLWSGGPGANSEYDGGQNELTAYENYENLAFVREELQKSMNEFSANNESYVDESGNVVSSDYPEPSDEVLAAIEALKGEKTNFGSYQELGELQIADGTKPYRIDATTNCKTSSSVSVLFDGTVGSSTTSWFSASGNTWGTNSVMPAEITVQYSVAYPLAAYSVANGHDAMKYGRSPESFDLYGSSNGIDWVLLDSRSNVGWQKASETRTFALSQTANYPYYKLSVTANGGTDPTRGGAAWGVELGEWTLHCPGASELAAATHNCKTADGLERLFDGQVTTATSWFSASGNTWGTNSVMPAEITLQYTAPKTVTGYVVTNGRYAKDYGRSPTEIKFFGSSDGTTWKELDHRTDVAWSSNKEVKTFTLSEAAYYTYYKFSVLANEGTDPKRGGAAWGTEIGELELLSPPVPAEEQEAEVTDYLRTLNLNQAVAQVSYQQDGVDYQREYFTSNPDNVLAVRLTASEETLTKRIMIKTPQQKAVVSAEGDTITIVGAPADQKNDLEHLEFAGQVKVITDGTVTAENGTLLIENAAEIILYTAAGTNYQQCTDNSYDYFDDEDPLIAVSARVNAAAQKGYADLYAAHVMDYTALFDRVKINLGGATTPEKTTPQLIDGYYTSNTESEDRYLETLYYQFGRYQLIATSREGSLPSNLQGIWAQGLKPSWNSDYHTNINVQMNYWAAETGNLAESHQTLIDYINAQVARGTETAQHYHYSLDENGEYQPARGWTAYHENNIWGNTAPATSSAYCFPVGAAWLCQHIWTQYEFSQDEAQLAENFDTLLGAALFWVDNLVEDERDGTLVTSPSYSPEHGTYSMGCTQDQAIVRELFENTLAAAEILNRDSDELDEIRSSLERLAGYQVGKAGQLQEWKDEVTMDITGDNAHRHLNHLYGLYPSNLIVPGRSAEDDALAEAAKVTLNTRGDVGAGWNLAWKINLWARLRDGNRAKTLLTNAIQRTTYDNMFSGYITGSMNLFQIDGNLGLTSGIGEMLLQSHGDAVELLPAIPTEWSSGSLTGLKARGNIEVAVEWEEGVPTTATLAVGTADPALQIKAAGIDRTIVTDSKGNRVGATLLNGDTLQIAAKAGETYTLTFGVDPTPVEGDVNEDGVFNIADVSAFLQRLNRGETAALPPYADANGDGKVTLADAHRLLKKLSA